MTPQQHALALVVEDRLSTLRSYRSWFRASPIMRRAMGSLEMEYRAEYRSLVALKWRARGIARAARNLEVQRTAAIDSGVGTWKAIRRQDLADEIELGMI